MKKLLAIFGLCALSAVPLGAALRARATSCGEPVTVAELELESSTVDGAEGVIEGPADSVELVRYEYQHELRHVETDDGYRYNIFSLTAAEGP